MWFLLISDNCYKDNPLDEKTKVENDKMTQNECMSSCKQSGHAYAGVQNSNQCFCGNKLPSSLLKVKLSECNMNCAGDTSEKCGGSMRMNIFKTRDIYSVWT